MEGVQNAVGYTLWDCYRNSDGMHNISCTSVVDVDTE